MTDSRPTDTREKYGVEVDPDVSKTAGDGSSGTDVNGPGVCPRCGTRLEEGNVPKCPLHGTEPLERR